MNKHDDDFIQDNDDLLDEEMIVEDDATEDSDDDEEDLTSEEDDEDEGLEEDDANAPAWENKRIKKMAQRHKQSKAEIKKLKSENARLTEMLQTDDPKLYTAVAEKIGVLPRFISTADAKKISEATRLTDKVELLTEILDDLDDKNETEYVDTKGQTWTRAELRQQKRKAQSELDEIAKAAKLAQATARKQMIIVVNAGLKALRAQKNKPEAKVAKRQGQASSRFRFDDDDTPARTRKVRPTADDDRSFSNMSAKERARAKLRRMTLADYDD